MFFLIGRSSCKSVPGTDIVKTSAVQSDFVQLLGPLKPYGCCLPQLPFHHALGNTDADEPVLSRLSDEDQDVTVWGDDKLFLNTRIACRSTVFFFFPFPAVRHLNVSPLVLLSQPQWKRQPAFHFNYTPSVSTILSHRHSFLHTYFFQTFIHKFSS